MRFLRELAWIYGIPAAVIIALSYLDVSDLIASIGLAFAVLWCLGWAVAMASKQPSERQSRYMAWSIPAVVVVLASVVLVSPTGPDSRAECIQLYVAPAQTEIAAQHLRQSCNRQFQGEDRIQLTQRDTCLRESLPNLSTRVAVQEAVRACPY